MSEYKGNCCCCDDEIYAQVQVGSKVDNFTATAVVGQDFKQISLDDYKGKYVVLFFYPMDFTFVCPTEIIKFNELLGEFESRNVQVLGASIDTKHVHRAYKNTPVKEGGIGDIKFPLIADVNKELADQFGVLLEGGIALRGSFLIDRDGVLQHSVINNLGLGRNIEEMIRMVDALQYTEEHGEVCPANWTKGGEGMKETPAAVKAYLSKK